MEASELIQSERIGAILVEKNLITDEQLERALALQQESGQRLGEIVVAEFGVPRLEVAGVLAEQWAGVEKPEPDAPKPIEPLTPAEVHLRRPLGELLVMRGFITPDQLDAALEEQRKSGARIGEILVERGAVSRLDLAAALSDYGSPAGGPSAAGHVAGVQASFHDDSLGAPPSAQGLSDDVLALVSDLELRLQTLERAAGGAPWQEDLRLVASDIRAAIGAVEARLEAGGPNPAEAELVTALAAVSTRIDALENAPVSAELDALRQELEELKTRPVTTEGIAELRATVERLEALPDWAAEIPRLASEVAELAARSDEFAARVDEIVVPVAGLSPRIDGLSARVEEVAAAIPVVETDGLWARIERLEEGSRAGGGTLEHLAGEVAALAARFAEVPDAGELSGRLEAVAEKAEFAQTGIVGLAGRVDELAASLPTEDVVEELRRELADLAARAGAGGGGAELGGAVASLAARLDEFAARVDEIVVPVAGLSPRIDGLSARVEEVAAAIPVVETDGLWARIERLEEGSRAGGGTLEHLAGEVAALAARFAEVPDAGELSGRLEAVAEKAEFAQTGIVGLAGRVDELAASLPTEDVVEELRRELADLAARAGAGGGGAELGGAVASLAARLDEFAARVDEIVVPVAGLSPRIDGLSARVEEVAAAIPVVETDGLWARIERLEEGSRAGGGTLEHLAGEVAALAARFAEVPDAGELSGRLEAVAEKAEFAQTGIVGLAGRVDELAASLPTEDVVEELRRELADLAARAGADGGGAELGGAVASLAARLDEFAARVDEIVVPVAGLSPRIDGLSARVEEVAAAIPVVETDGLWARIERLEEGSRAGGGTLEHLAGETSELRTQLQELALASARDESVALLEARVGELEHRVAATAPPEELRDEIQRIGASASAERDSLAHALFARVEEITATVPAADEVSELRLRVDELASRPIEDDVFRARVGELAARVEGLALVEATVADLTASVAGLDGRIDRGFRDGHDRVEGLADELNMRIGGLAEELGRRIDGVSARADGLVSHDQAEATAAEQAAWIRDELEVLREWTNVRAAAVDAALAGADDARVTGQQELGNRIDETAGALRADVEAQAEELGARLGAHANETAALGARVDALQESAAATDRLGDTSREHARGTPSGAGSAHHRRRRGSACRRAACCRRGTRGDGLARGADRRVARPAKC